MQVSGAALRRRAGAKTRPYIIVLPREDLTENWLALVK